jgi:FlaA1/EpsC-like NDP-sugar epimerase
VGKELDEIIDNFPRLIDEFKYDKDRIAETVASAQQLVDMVIRNVPNGTIFKMADDCNTKVGNFRRKFSFMVQHQRNRVVHDVVEPIMLEVDQIYHLACPASPPHYQYNPIKTIKTSTEGTLNMLGLAKRVQVF